MTREELARRIGWPTWMWVSGAVNVAAMIPQIVKMLQTKSSEGVSEYMIGGILFVQATLSLDGFFRKDKKLMIPLGLCALVSVVTLVLIHHYRA